MSREQGTVVVLRGSGTPMPEWRATLQAVDIEVDEAGAWLAGADAVFRGADCVLVDAESLDALPAARHVHRADHDLQVVIVTASEERRRAISRGMVFTPGLGELWLSSPREVAGAIAERAAGVTRQRRTFRRTRARLSAEAVLRSPQQTERALISDAYLADLLQVVPDPVFSVDAAGRILSANPANERVLGGNSGARVGSALADVVRAPDGTTVAELLRNAAAGPARLEVEFTHGDGGGGFGELLVARVARSDPPLYAIVLHDLTRRTIAQRQLEEQAVELENQSASLHEQATELEQVNEELLDQRAALEHALESRSRFYAAMSHELRTPINAVMGYNSLVLDGVYGELTQPQRDAIGRAQRATVHLLELVNDVLDLAKIEAGRLEVAPEPVNPQSLVEDLLLSVRPAADANGTELQLECTVPAAMRVVTDPRRVRQILLNLVSNAVKFAGGSPVIIRCASPDEETVEFQVIDQGPGIPEQDHDRVFEEFVQLDEKSQSGTGLGLPISRRLARLLGGSLRVHSVPGAGSTFTLSLPRTATR